jgi:hypothetical protein
METNECGGDYPDTILPPSYYDATKSILNYYYYIDLKFTTKNRITFLISFSILPPGKKSCIQYVLYAMLFRMFVSQ